MNFEALHSELRRLLRGLVDIQAHFASMMEERARRDPMAGRPSTAMEYKWPQQQANNRRGFPSNYFSLESLLLLICLTASLLILPLILPPLPPPPLLLLLLPIGILVVLLILGFMPSDVRDIASSYL